MDKFGLNNKIIESYRTFRKAYEKLKEFIDTDNGSEKDRAARIKENHMQTFEEFIKKFDKKIIF